MRSEVGSPKVEVRHVRPSRSLRLRLQTCLLLLIAPPVICTSAFAQAQDIARPSFSEWLAGVRTDALARGIRPEIVDEALAGVEEPLPVVLERDRSQAETVL